MSLHRKPIHSTQAVLDFTLLWGKAQDSVRAFISVSVPNVHDREDVLQSTVHYLIEHFEEYDPQRPFVAWAIGVARYRILEYRQKQTRRGRELGGDALQMVSQAFMEHADDAEPRADALRQCLQMLNQKQLKIISRKYYDGLGHEAIAAEFDMKPNTVSVMIRRIRLALGKCIEARIESGAC
ncbi:MAG: sigma-70 family RNA polymerase sigma factor [Phycisphaeraceae bacterium]|nr:sigma-70 family RNA polymerase sigma factor [Phycisphaeraceae bacterium]